MKNTPRILMIALSAVFAAEHAIADDLQDSRYYISPNVSYTAPDTKWNTNDGLGYGVGVGKPISENWNLEFNAGYSTQSYKSGSGNVANTDTNVDAMYFFTRNTDFSPFVEAGVGGLYVNGNSNSSWVTDGNVGIGFMKWMSDIAIRADVRYRYADSVSAWANNGTSASSFSPGDWIASVGLVIPLGPKAQPAPKPVPVAPAPAPEPVAAAPEPAPAPAPAKEVARPVAHTKLVLEGSHFNFNKATLRPSGKTKMDEDAKMLMAYPDINVKISGYTDSTGPAKYNLALSKKRADTVFRYLESRGVSASRISMQGYGKADPVASNKTKAGRAQNRRVEIETLN